MIDREVERLLFLDDEIFKSAITLIASENHPTRNVRRCLSTNLAGLYSEGRPYARYYAERSIIEQVELLAESRLRQCFDLDGEWYVNVQPYSGSIANYIVLRSLLKRGDKIMFLDLNHGGHLSHGFKASIAGKDFETASYFVDPQSFRINYEQVLIQAMEFKPKLIIAGASAYPRIINFQVFGEIAKRVGALLLADIAHIAGLIVGGEHPSPFPWADVVTSTTQKTLRGARGAFIICRKEFKARIEKGVFPGLQGGPHNHSILAHAACFGEALKTEFKDYARQICLNAKTLAEELQLQDFEVITGGTDNHLINIDVSRLGVGGKDVQDWLKDAGIFTNKNLLPYDTRPPSNPSGLRLGTPAISSRGMGQEEVKLIAHWINDVIKSGGDQAVISDTAAGVENLARKFTIK